MYFVSLLLLLYLQTVACHSAQKIILRKEINLPSQIVENWSDMEAVTVICFCFFVLFFSKQRN